MAGDSAPLVAPLTRIAFGSCAKQFEPQPIWQSVLRQSPDLFIFLGDNIYGDYDGEKAFTPSAETLRRDWQRLADEPHFRVFRKQVPIMATWDNHDYGKHDGGAEFNLKRVSQQIFLDFFDEPRDSVRRATPGIYDARIIGPEGKRVQIILLDTRFFKGPFIRDGRSKAEKEAAGNVGSMANYLPNASADATLLGEAQWQWLEAQLTLPAEVRLIASSTQMVADQKRMDEWGNYPLERQRLLEMMAGTMKGRTILLSGNVHFTEISKTRIGGRKIIDFTSSGLTHSNPAYAKAKNPYRVAGAYDGLNFGLLEIDWNADARPAILLKAMDKKGMPVFQYRL
ncbi:MAG: alkaline phosphatase family protein [Gammaproteobacteria bacterium]|nr:alkaline phosphatase family protein [Gammaproteobacteria bacterium]